MGYKMDYVFAALATVTLVLTTYSLMLKDPRDFYYVPLIADGLYMFATFAFVIYMWGKVRSDAHDRGQPMYLSIMEILLTLGVVGISLSLVLGDLLAKKEPDTDEKKSIQKNSFYAAVGFFVLAVASWLVMFQKEDATLKQRYYNSQAMQKGFPTIIILFAVIGAVHVSVEKKTISG